MDEQNKGNGNGKINSPVHEQDQDVKNIIGAVKPIMTWTITLYQNGGVSVNGLLDNFIVFRDVMNAAERAVIDRMVKAGQERQAQNRIVIPKMGMPGKLRG